MNSFLASGSPLNSVDALPWWLQLLIGVALLFSGFALGKINERKGVDSEAIGVVAFAMKFAAVIVVLHALF